MRGLGVSFLVRRARSSWLLLACVAVTVLVATGLAAAEWTFAAEAIQPGAQSFLAAPQNRVIRLSGVVNTGEAAADTRLIRATLRRAWPGLGFQLQGALWAEPIQLSTSASGTFSTQIQPASLEGISAQVTLTARTWPGPPRRGSPVPVALPAMARGNLGALDVNTSAALSQLGLANPEGLQVTSNLPQILDGIASTSVLSQSLFTIAALEPPLTARRKFRCIAVTSVERCAACTTRHRPALVTRG